MYAKLGRYLKEERIRKGYHQSEIASLVGLSQAAIAQFENGRVGLNLGKFLKIARFLNLDVNYALSFIDALPLHRTISDRRTSKVETKISKLDTPRKQKTKEISNEPSTTNIVNSSSLLPTGLQSR
jgi:transcriptional regulator with XRE-family HTH domain